MIFFIYILHSNTLTKFRFAVKKKDFKQNRKNTNINKYWLTDWQQTGCINFVFKLYREQKIIQNVISFKEEFNLIFAICLLIIVLWVLSSTMTRRNTTTDITTKTHLKVISGVLDTHWASFFYKTKKNKRNIDKIENLLH